MLKSLGVTGLLAITLTATPLPSRQEVLNFTFGAGQFGCITRGIRALNANNSVRLVPVPDLPGDQVALKLDVNRAGLRELLTQMMTSTKACGEQALYLLRPESEVEERDSLPMPPRLKTTRDNALGINWPWN